MKRILPYLATLFLLAACGGGGTDDSAVQTQVAQLLANQAATNAAQQTVPTVEQPTAAPIVPQTTGDASSISIPPEAACLPVGTDRVVGTVTEIFSGDEIEVDVNGVRYDVRYIGVDAGDLPATRNVELVEGQQVLLVRDVTDVDEYGRYPRYVLTDGVFVNYELLKSGAAFVSIEPPDEACERTFNEFK